METPFCQYYQYDDDKEEEVFNLLDDYDTLIKEIEEFGIEEIMTNDDFEEDFVIIDDQYRSKDVLHDDFENRKLDTVDNNDDQCNSVRRDQNYINGGNNIV